ncbi:MAG: hypothetical protein WCD69_14470 [Xanthobacteraceae bacterium]
MRIVKRDIRPAIRGWPENTNFIEIHLNSQFLIATQRKWNELRHGVSPEWAS